MGGGRAERRQEVATAAPARPPSPACRPAAPPPRKRPALAHACSCPPADGLALHAAEAKGRVALHRHHAALRVRHSSSNGVAQAHAHGAVRAGVQAAAGGGHRLQKHPAGSGVLGQGGRRRSA